MNIPSPTNLDTTTTLDNTNTDNIDVPVQDNPTISEQDAREAKILYLENALNQCNAELNRILYPDAPLELQVKTAGNVPTINPRYLFATLKDISLDSTNLDTRLIFLAQLTKPDSSAASLPHLFYKFNVTPPADEPQFESVNSSGTTLRMPYPAVLLIRCVLGEDNKHLEIKAVYVVAAETDANSVFLDTNNLQVTLNNLVKLETEDKYLKRTTPNANDAPIIGSYTNVVLITRTMDPNSSNVDKLIEFIKNEQRTSVGNKSTYALRRFKIWANERVILNIFRNLIRSSGPKIPLETTVKDAAVKVNGGVLRNFFNNFLTTAATTAGAGGKRTKRTKRIKMKYSTKKSKRKAKANATKHNRFKGFKYMTSKRK